MQRKASSDRQPASPKKRKLFGRFFERSTRKPPYLLSVLVNTLRIVLVLVLCLGLAGMGALLGVVKGYMDSTPTLNVEKIDEQDQTSFIYDVNGDLITSFKGTENRIWAAYDEFPQQLINAVVSIEDNRFFKHNGVDIKRLVGAFVNNLQNETVQGGSTITQQLIKLTILSPDRTYKRKLQEAYLAMQLETQYDKTEILESYLNTINLGSSNYGMKAAAQDYFGKTLDQLTLRECAMLAGLTQNPYAYNPRRNYLVLEDPERTDKRTNLVLSQMYQYGYITREEYDAALEEQVTILPKATGTDALYDMPYFVEYAVYDVVTSLIEQRNLTNDATTRREIENELRTGGYHIYTTVDPEIQHSAEDTIYNWDSWPKLANEENSVIKTVHADGSVTETVEPQTAACIIDYHTGQIKAVVGGRTPPSQMKELNRAYQSHMPVGSSIKPLAVYGPALDKGASPASIFYDVPLPISGWGTERGYPNNYSGYGFSGAQTLRTAIIKSINVVAAQTLMGKVTVEDSKNYLLNLGFNPEYINADGPGLALGTSGPTVIEMAAAFGAIGNEGVYLEPVSFTKVVDSDGNIILDSEKIQTRRQVYKPTTAWLLVDMMTDALKSGSSRNARLENMTCAGKTGTNDDFKGVFFAGMTPYYAATVWVGHDNYKALASGTQGGSGAGPVWKALMASIHEGLENKAIIDKTPEDLGLQQATVCQVSGKLATDECRSDPNYSVVTDWFVPENIPTETCDMHRQLLICKDSGKPATIYCPDESCEKRGYVVLPSDFEYYGHTASELAPYIEGASSSLPRGIGDTKIDPENQPNLAREACDKHTKQTQELDAAKKAALESINRATGLYNEKGAYLTAEAQATYVGAINDLTRVYNAGGPVEELRTGTAKLDALSKSLFDNLQPPSPSAPPAEPDT